MPSAREFLKTDIKIDGLKELERFIAELPKRALKKALRQSVNAAGTPIARDARRMAPRLTGTLRKAIKKAVRVYPNGNAIAVIGADRGVTSPKKNPSAKKKTGLNIPANYIHLVERGVRAHPQPNHKWFKITGHPGFKGTTFLERAFKSNESKAKAIMEAKMQEVILKEAAKLASK